MRAMVRGVWRAARPAGAGLMLAFAPTVALANPAHDPAATASNGSAQEEAEQHDEAAADDPHAHYKNALALFLGGTYERVDGGDIHEQGFTFGIEYARRVTPRFSIGGVLERAGGEIRGTLLIVQAYYRLVGGLFAIAGPGVEFRDAHSEEPTHHGRLAANSETPMRERDTTVFLMRVGAMYEFEIDRWLVAPIVAIDFVGRDEALVVGASFGYAF